jgi:hypothetical protein
MGKDKTGKDVRLDRKDYDRIKEYGRPLSRAGAPFELEMESVPIGRRGSGNVIGELEIERKRSSSPGTH